MRDLLAEFTGQRFRLMKSGPQGGVDVIGDATGSGLVLGLEGKHYKAKTRLGLDELKSKLRDAAATFPAMDLWLLATTRPISGGDVLALEAVGAEHGVDVVVLDWPHDGSVALPALAALCAAAPSAARARLGAAPGLLADLDAVGKHPMYPQIVAKLRERFTCPLVGYGAVREHLRQWMRRRMTSTAKARLAFDSHANLEEPGVKRVVREPVNSQLDGWWTQPTVQAAAVLGEEGVGKTWAMLAWWLKASAADPDFPLTLIVPARDVNDADGPELLAQSLFRATGVRDVSFWRRRLNRWIAAPGARPVLFVILDGLNQKWAFTGWSDLILSISAGEWEGQAAVALSCRPDHWSSRLKSLEDLTPTPRRIDVARFDNEELDQLLAAYGLSRKDFLPELLTMLRVPRLCHMAIARREELRDSGDITSERLIYEDWRHRHHRARQHLSHEEFKRFVARLGRELLADLDTANLSRAELLARFDEGGARAPGEFEGVLSEVVDGRWLAPTGQPNRFRVDRERVPHALGLALLEEVRQTPTFEEAADRIAEIFEPVQALDTSVAILRNAVTFAALDPQVSGVAKQALLAAWLGAQNAGPVDFESFWRLIGWTPELVLDAAERLWFEERGSGREDEALVKGFANAWRWPEVRTAVEHRLTDWFSRYWLDPLEGEILGQVTQDETAAARRSATCKRAQAWAVEATALNLPFQVYEVPPKRQAWGSYRATELLSWLPRAPLIRPLTAWAVTRTILDSFRQEEQMAWVLRWNENDPAAAEEAVIKTAKQLLAGGQVAQSAALTLLSALATPAAQQLRDAHAAREEPLPSRREVEWNVEEALSRKRYADAPLKAVAAMRGDPTDPELELDEDKAAKLRGLAVSLTDEQLRVPPGQTEDGGFDVGRLALSRWAPDLRADIERRRFRAAQPVEAPRRGCERILRVIGLRRRPEPPPQLAEHVLKRLPLALLVLRGADLAPWRELARRARDIGAWDDRLQAAALAGASAAAQAQILVRRPPELPIPAWFGKILQQPDADALAMVAPRLSGAAAAEEIRFWLTYLELAGVEAMPSGWPPLGALLTHSNADVRTMAMRVAYLRQDDALADRLVASEWSWREDLKPEEAVYGSLLLTLAPIGEQNDLVKRIYPQALGHLADRWPARSDYLSAFADYVQREFDYLLNSKSQSYPRTLLNRSGGWEALAREMPDRLAGWIKPFEVEAAERLVGYFFFAERFPLMEALEALDTVRSGIRANVITRTLKASRRTGIRAGNLYGEALKLRGPEGEEARQLVLAEANDDQKLFELAEGLQESGQVDWLFEQIRVDLAADAAGRIARGLTLAGFLENTAEANALWDGELQTPPASGWLAKVHERARARFQSHVWADHWLDCYRGKGSDDLAFCAHELLVAACDSRLYLGRRRPSPEQLEAWSWRRAAHWRLGWSAIQDAAKARNEGWKKLFLTSNPPPSNQHPRRR